MFDSCLWIYAIPDLQPINHATGVHPRNLHPIHILPISGNRFRRGGLSRPYIDALQTQIVLCTASGVYGVVIPIEGQYTPCVSTLMDFETERSVSVCVGLRRALVRCKNSSAFALSYRKLDEQARDGQVAQIPSLRRRQLPNGFKSYILPLMDEETGRVVQQQSNYTLSILDFAACHRSE